MVYPGSFHRLVLAGSLYADTFNTTLSIVPVSGTGTFGLPETDSIISAVAATLNNRWDLTSGSNAFFVHQNAILRSIKLNSIGPDGKYNRPETFEYVFPTPKPGGGAFNAPAQLATVASIRTAVDRGLASKGRMFFPVCGGYEDVESDGRASVDDANHFAGAVAAWFAAINTVYAAAQSGDESLGRVGVASNKGAGQFRIATRVTAGRVTDTVRSRRNKQLEAPVEAPVPA